MKSGGCEIIAKWFEAELAQQAQSPFGLIPTSQYNGPKATRIVQSQEPVG